MAEIDTSKSTPEKRVALVTGGATRLGREIALTLHAAGFDLCVHYNTSSSNAAELVAIMNRQRADSAFSVAQDLKEDDSAEKIISKITAHTGRLDLLVNNASTFNKNPIDNSTTKEWDEMMLSNVKAPYYLSINSAPLLKRTSGAIVNISDIHGNRPRPDYSIYCVSKAALDAVTLSLAIELAPEIRVNSVAPGAIIWASSEKNNERIGALGATPLRRTGTPKDIGEAVLYLAESPYVTGQILKVDGGRALNV